MRIYTTIYSGEVRGGVGTHSTPDLPTVYNPHKSSVAAYQCFSFINLKMANEKSRNM